MQRIQGQGNTREVGRLRMGMPNAQGWEVLVNCGPSATGSSRAIWWYMWSMRRQFPQNPSPSDR
jgi:hypothetical protein